MTIAVNAVNAGYPDDNSAYVTDCFFRLAQQLPGHRFIFITANAADAKYTALKNITAVHAGPSPGNPLRLQYWLRFTLPAILKKNNADLLVSNGYCSLSSKLPQLLFITDLSFLHHPEWYKKSWLQFYKKNMPGFLKKAAAIITPAAVIKEACITLNKEVAANITILPPFADELFKPVIHWQQKETVKEKYTGGKEYFLYSGPIDTHKNIIHLLKAFSFFKQRQKSNMLLVLASAGMAHKKILQSLSAYKYRSDVVVTENLPVAAMAMLTAAAYAVVHPVQYDGTGIFPIQAICCDVPVIASGTATLKEICGPAAVYSNPEDFNDLAAKMMLVFKDEDERNLLIARGRERAQLYSIEKGAALLGKIIVQFAGTGSLNQ